MQDRNYEKRRNVFWSLFLITIAIIITLVILFINQKEEAPTKIGVLMVGESRHEKLEGLRSGLQDIGYDSSEFEIFVKNARDDAEKLKPLIYSLLDQDPDILVTLGGVETVELKEVIQDNHLSIPVVFAGVAAPKEVGLIEDFQRPGGMFTGINNYHTVISAKRLELLRDLVPTTERVFALYDETVQLSRFSLDETFAAADLLNIDIIPINIQDDNYAEQIFTEHGQGDGLLILPSYKIEATTQEIVEIADKCNLPSMALYKHEVEAGFLAGHGASFYEQGYQAARHLSSIIQGNHPSEMPVEMPDEIRSMINFDVSEKLGISLDETALLNAEIIYKDKNFQIKGVAD